jgi:hypothetical protein
MIDFESCEVTYPPIFKCLKLVVELFLAKSVGSIRYRRFGVFGLHGHFDLIAILGQTWWFSWLPFWLHHITPTIDLNTMGILQWNRDMI